MNNTINTDEIFNKAYEEASKVIGVDPAYFGEEGTEEVERQLNKMGYSLDMLRKIDAQKLQGDYLTDKCKNEYCEGKYEYSFSGGGTCDKCGNQIPCI